MDHAAVHFTWLSLAVWIPSTCYIYAAAWNLSDSPVTKCEHPFIDKMIVITESDVPNTWLLGLSSKLQTRNKKHMLDKDLTQLMQSLSQVFQNQARERKVLLAGCYF